MLKNPRSGFQHYPKPFSDNLFVSNYGWKSIDNSIQLMICIDLHQSSIQADISKLIARFESPFEEDLSASALRFRFHSVRPLATTNRNDSIYFSLRHGARSNAGL